MIGELQRIAGQCDGVRCDMAMLVLPDVFERTWGRRSATLLAEGHRRGARAASRTSCSWPRSTGTWNGRCSSRASTTPTTSGCTTGCATAQARPVREHLQAGLDYQDQLARFLENHDEPRAAAAFAREVHAAAALITYATPGLRFFHQGQLEGRRVRISPHLVRGPDEPVDATLARFYARLLAALRHKALRDGLWSLLDCNEAWAGNASVGQFIAWQWQGPGEAWLCAAVNYAPQPGQCFVRLPGAELKGRTLRLRDLLGPAEYERPGNDLVQRGLYLDLPAWGHHLFEVIALP